MKSHALIERLRLEPFRTACWNVYNFTPTQKLEPVLEKSVKWGVQLWFMNEAKGKDITTMLNAAGLETVNYRQYRLAWDPARFALDSEWHERISDTPYFKKDGKSPQYSSAQAVLLRDLRSARKTPNQLTLEAWSYHTPAGIQKAQDEPGYPFRRYTSLLESMVFLSDRADDTEADGFMSAGDDNWDEDGPANDGGGVQTEDTFPVLLGRSGSGNLRQISSGVGTFARRDIDDYRIQRLRNGGHVRPTGELNVIPGGGAEKPQHKMHMREWEWYYRFLRN